MKVCFFDFITHLGGAQRSMAEMLGRVAANTQVCVLDAFGVVPEYRALLQTARIQYEILHKNPSFPTIGANTRPVHRAIRAIAALPELVRVGIGFREQVTAFVPDYVHVISPKALWLAAAAMFGYDYPIIYWCRGRFLPDMVIGALRSRRIHGALCLTAECKRNALQRGVPEERIQVVPNGIDVRAIVEASSREAALPGREHPVKLLVPATVVPGKGHPCAIRALERLVASGCDAALYFAGDVPDAANEYAKSLMAQAVDAGVDSRVYMLGWRGDILGIMRQCSAVILPTKSEGMPRVIMEAIALGVPVAATPVGAIPELLDDGKGGWLFGVDDHDALAAAVLSIVTAPDARARTATAFARLKSLNDPEGVVVQYSDACKSLLDLRAK